MSSNDLEISRDMWERIREFRKYPSKIKYLKLVKMDDENEFKRESIRLFGKCIELNENDSKSNGNL